MPKKSTKPKPDPRTENARAILERAKEADENLKRIVQGSLFSRKVMPGYMKIDELPEEDREEARKEFFKKIPKETTLSSGSMTNEEQDFLRARIVLACAGFESILKHLIHDALAEDLKKEDVEKDGAAEKAREELQKFLQRRLKDEKGNSILSEILLNKHPLEALIPLYVKDLTKGSLQSVKKCISTISALGLEKETSLKDFPKPDKESPLKEAFKARNNIIHEMDANVKNRTQGVKHWTQRRLRPIDSMVDTVLGLAEKIIEAAEGKSPAKAGTKKPTSPTKKTPVKKTTARKTPTKKKSTKKTSAKKAPDKPSEDKQQPLSLNFEEPQPQPQP